MNINDELELIIDKLVYEGASLAKYNCIPVFVEGGCPGDVVKAKILKINKNYIKAKITEILTPSSHRVKPFCPIHNVRQLCLYTAE